MVFGDEDTSMFEKLPANRTNSYWNSSRLLALCWLLIATKADHVTEQVTVLLIQPIFKSKKLCVN